MSEFSEEQVSIKSWHVYVSAPGVGITKNDIAKSLYLESIFYFCADQPCIFSWPMMISNSVNEFFVAV